MSIEDEAPPAAAGGTPEAPGPVPAISIDFRRGGNAAAFLGEGWSFQEDDGIWAIGAASDLILPPGLAGAFVLDMLAWPMVAPPALQQQKLEICLNDRLLFSEVLSGPEPQIITCRIPPGLLRAQGGNTLSLRHPDAAAPADFIASHADYRRLGIHVESLRIAASEDSAASPATAPGPAGPAETTPDERGLILFYWDETPYEIGCLLEGFPPFDDAFEIRFVNNSIPWSTALEDLAERDRGRVVALWEEVGLPPEDGTAEMRARDRSHGRMSDIGLRPVKIPRLAADCLWPLRCHDPRLVPEPPIYPKGRYPCSDRAAIALIAEKDRPDDALYERYLALSHEMMPDLAAEFSRDVRSWTALDARCDIKILRFILENFRSSRLFHAPETPAAPLIVYVVEHLLATLLPTLSVLPSAFFKEFAYYVHGYQGPFLDQAPVHPLVAERLELSFLSPDELYRRGHAKRTFRQHVLDYIRWEPWFS
jgi:hypothetical protein